MEKEINVLFLDDEENILRSLGRLFRDASYGITTTIDPKEVFNIIEKENIKVILSDQRMPTTTGIAVLAKVREKHPDIIRILFTGYADIQAVEDAINISRVYRFINKPWNSVELKDAVDRAVEHYELVHENKGLYNNALEKNKELEELIIQMKGMYEKQKKFTATVSHELRTPLASMTTALDIIMCGTAGDLTYDQMNFLSKAKNNVDRLGRLINDVLDLSKLEAGKSDLKRELLNINSVIKEASEFHDSQAKKQGLELKFELDESLPYILIDKDRISQVMSNLLSNAIRYTEKGSVTVKSEKTADGVYVKVSVIDTGVGIKMEDYQKLFSKFQQVGEAIERKQGGTGLGLAICHELVHMHNGKIDVKSEYGKGSCFYFILPIDERRS